MRVSGRVFKGWGGGGSGEGRIPAFKNFEDIRRRTHHSSVVFGNKMVLEIGRACLVKMRDL